MNVALLNVMKHHLKNRSPFNETLIEANYGPALLKIIIESKSLRYEARKTFALLVWRAIQESKLMEFRWSQIRHSDFMSGFLSIYDPIQQVRTKRGIRIAAKNVHAGLKLRVRRQQLRMTQEQLASRAGIDRTHLSHIEHGKVIPKDETWLRIQSVLNPKELPPDCNCPCHTHATNL